jgi:hypothetical protein
LGGRVDDLVHLDVRALRVRPDPQVAGHLAYTIAAYSAVD